MNCPARSPSVYAVLGPEALPPILTGCVTWESQHPLWAEQLRGVRERSGSPSLETGTADPGMTEGRGILHGPPSSLQLEKRRPSEQSKPEPTHKIVRLDPGEPRDLGATPSEPLPDRPPPEQARPASAFAHRPPAAFSQHPHHSLFLPPTPHQAQPAHSFPPAWCPDGGGRKTHPILQFLSMARLDYGQSPQWNQHRWLKLTPEL